MRGRLRRPPHPPGARCDRERDGPEARRAAGRKTCCKINVRSSRFSAERPYTYFATVCRRGDEKSLTRFSSPRTPLLVLLLDRTPYGDDRAAAVREGPHHGGGGSQRLPLRCAPRTRPPRVVARGHYAGALAPPPAPPGARCDRERDGPEARRAAGRKTCCKINVRSSRFSAERPYTYFATVCRRGDEKSLTRFSSPRTPLLVLLLDRTPYGDDRAAAV